MSEQTPGLRAAYDDVADRSLHLIVGGDLDHRLADDLRVEALDRLRADHAGLVLDLAEVTYLDSSVIRSIVQIWKTAQRRGIEMTLIVRHRVVAAVVSFAQLGDIMTVVTADDGPVA